MIAAIIAYFLSACAAVLMLASISLAFEKASRDDDKAAINILGVFLFGLVAWGFAYLGGAI